MSSYFKETRSPKTGNWFYALWQDDYFGKHNYGVQFFPGDDFYDPRKVELVTKDENKTPDTVSIGSEDENKPLIPKFKVGETVTSSTGEIDKIESIKITYFYSRYLFDWEEDIKVFNPTTLTIAEAEAKLKELGIECRIEEDK